MATSKITPTPYARLTMSDGTNNWIVRKYDNGDCEAYLLHDGRSMSSQILWTTGHYAGDFTQVLPIGLFTSIDYAEVQIQTYGIVGYATANTTSVHIYYTIDAAGISGVFPLLIKVVGRWK